MRAEEETRLVEALDRMQPRDREVLAKKWKKMSVTAQTADSVSGNGDDGRFELRLKGPLVTSLEGLPE